MSHFDFSSSNLSLYIPFIMKPANFREKNQTKPSDLIQPQTESSAI